jgi:glutathione S-transferase
MSEQRNPRYWPSQWYSTSQAKEPWPGGWYWHDEIYNWFGPYADEDAASDALADHLEAEQLASDLTPRTASFSLYYHPLSTHSQKALIALREKGFAFEPKITHLENPTEREHYEKIYPLGKLPLLVLNHGPLIPESSIIVEYLDSLGGDRLISEDPDLARKTRYKDRMFDYLADAACTLFNYELKHEGAPEAVSRAHDQVGIVFDFIENELGDQPWANGTSFSLSDCAAAAALFYTARAMSFDEHPRMKAYARRLGERSSVMQVREEAAPHLEALKKRHAA